MKKLVLLFVLLPVVALAAEPTCKRSPALTGACRIVKGTLGLTGNGTTLITDDGQVIAVKAPPDSNADISTTVMQNWLYWQSKTNDMHTRMSGSFEICPLPPNGTQPAACINAGTHLAGDKDNAAPGN